jgi:uncharacterized protein (DUF924 family)
MAIDPVAQEILTFWFGDLSADKEAKSKAKLWWGKDSSVDAFITENFREHLLKAIKGEYNHWQRTPKESLAFVVLLDQFSRQIFRDTPKAFEADAIALNWLLEGMDRKHDQSLMPLEKVFYYLPLEHSEDLKWQNKSVKLFLDLHNSSSEEQKPTFKQYYEYALGHHKIIERFGRFPHRNKTLRRDTTQEEAEFLTQPNSSY